MFNNFSIIGVGKNYSPTPGFEHKIICSKQDLKKFIAADITVQGMTHPLLAKYTYGENYQIKKYKKELRKLEYYKNIPHPNILQKILYAWYLLKHRRSCLKTGMYIAPNSCGKGLHIVHPGFIRLGVIVDIGDNCTVLPMALCGKKSPNLTEFKITIGDNCYISTGVTILGPVRIGNNVTIAAGAVVTKDVPDNCVVAGVPAKIVKYKLYNKKENKSESYFNRC